MSKSNGSRIKELTIRFNKEVLPFQHIRIEGRATITKEDEPDEVAQELEFYLSKVCRRMEDRLYPKPNQPVPETTTEVVQATSDGVPY
jgi:hypothetical protein